MASSDIVQAIKNLNRCLSNQNTQILELLQELVVDAQNETDVELVCLSNDGGETIITGWEVFNTNVNPPTSTLYINGTDVTGQYEVVPCNNIKYDYEKETICVDGRNWTKWYVWDKTGDGDPNLVSILWLDENDVVVNSPDPILIDNVNCVNCNPLISDAFGDDISMLTPMHSFVVTKPHCCEVLITTTIGQFKLIEGETMYSSSDFKCSFNITDIEIINGTCGLSDVHIISNKLF